MNAERACDDFRAASEAVRRRYVGPGLTRRQVVGRGLAAGLAVYASRAMSIGQVLESAHASAAAEPGARALVSVFLPGGCDLLDTLVPLDRYGRYADLRPRIRQAETAELGATGLGIHPALRTGARGGVKGLFEAGKIGLLPGIDYANPDLSHFHSRSFWDSGLVTPHPATGWLGRYLDARGGRDNPLQGVSMTGVLSPALRSARAPVASVVSPDAAQLSLHGAWGPAYDAAMGAWDRMARRPAERPGERAATHTARIARTVARQLAPYTVADGADPIAPKVAYPSGNPLGDRLRTLAGLLDAPLGIRVAAAEMDKSFDTHDGQPATLDRNLREVSTALAAFQADLEQRGIADRVLTLVWSEFGRRPAQNDSQGTDHGAGGIAWVQGTRARAGVLSDFPSLTELDRDGNLAVTLDFRRVYCSLLEGWLGADAGAVIPNARSFGRMRLTR